MKTNIKTILNYENKSEPLLNISTGKRAKIFFIKNILTMIV